MALFKYKNYLSQTKSGSFDLLLQPNAFIPCAGIFRCTGCGVEMAFEAVGTFPDRNHHPHTPAQGPLQWQLVVATVSDLPAPYLHGG